MLVNLASVAIGLHQEPVEVPFNTRVYDVVQTYNLFWTMLRELFLFWWL